MAVKTLLFRFWSPDRSIFDPDASHTALNVLPVAGTYRPLPQLAQKAALSVSGTRVEQPILSGYAHVYTPSAPIQRVRPDERTGSTDFKLETRATADANDDLTQQEQEGERVGTEFFDDGGYVVSPGGCTNALFETTVKVVEAPPAATHYLFLRFKIFDPDDANSWTVLLRLKGAAGEIASLLSFGSGEQDWTTTVYTLTAGEMGDLVAGDYTTEDQLTLEVDATINGTNQTKNPDSDVLVGSWLDEGAEFDDPDLFSKLTDASDATYVDSPPLPAGGTPQLVQFGLEDFGTPASLANLAVIIKWKRSNIGVKSDFYLLSGGRMVAKAENVTPPATATEETITLTLEDNMDFPDVDWTALQLGIAPSNPIDVASDVLSKYLPSSDVGTPDWGTVPLFSKINDADDGTLITSPSMTANVDKSFEIDLDTTPDIASDTTRERQVVVRARNDDGAAAHSFKVEVLEDSVAVASKTFSLAAGAALADKTWSLDNIMAPTSDISDTGWSTNPLFSKIDDDTNEITSAGAAGDNFIVGFPTPTDPNSTAGWFIRLTGYVSSGGTSANLHVVIYDGATPLEQQSSSITLDEDENTYIVVFSGDSIANADDYTDLRIGVSVVESGPVVKIKRLILETPNPHPDITDYEGMRLKISAVGDAASGWTISIADVKLEVAAARRITVYEAKVQADSNAYIGVSWMQLQIPKAASNSLVAEGDKTTMVAARLRRIYQVNPYGPATVFTDISRGATDLAAGAYPWDFCSWGGLVLGTNKSEEVQKFDPDSDSATSDLITSTDKPKGRFIAVCRNQVVLANIAFSGSPAGFPDEVWGGADEDAADFDDAAMDGQFRQRIRQTPGEITGFQGGEYMLIWKRTSLVRGTYINSPLWWRFDVISSTIGTVQPDSIVRWRRLTFFYGTDGRFYKTDGSQEPEPIDEGVHYSLGPQGDWRIQRVSSNNPHEIQNRIIGAYEHGSKCVVWAARGPGDNPFENRRLYIYNTIEDRFSTGFINFDSHGISSLVNSGNSENNSEFLMYGLSAFTFLYSGAAVRMAEFSGSGESLEIDTEVMALDSQDAEGHIGRVRLVYRADTLKPINLTYTIKILTWNDRSSQQNPRSETLYSYDASPDNGWISCDLKGRFAKAIVSISREALGRFSQTRVSNFPTYPTATFAEVKNQPFPPIKELLGIQIDPESAEK